MIRRVAYVLIVVAVSCVAAGQSKPAHPEMIVTTSWLARHLHDKNLVLVQVGPKESEYEDGHIPGARYLPNDKIVAERDGVKGELLNTDQLVDNLQALGISNRSRVVIYASQIPTVATRLYWTLDYLGIAKNASLLDGGLARWRAEERPIVKETFVASKPGNIRPRLQPDLLARLDEVSLISSSHEQELLLDSRPEKRYLQGHIPGAIPLYWQQTVKPGELNQLLDFDAIRSAYEKAGVRPGAKIVTYCETGFQATHAYFTAKYLGYKVKMYDGSYQEWNEVKKQPVVAGSQPR
jgi:thiosulfate/3-mercaptopyruvate sulfurtransferase